MDCLLKNANVYIDGSFKKTDIFIKDNMIVSVDGSVHHGENVVSFDFNNKYIFPGFTDVHVHLREPGFLCKETIETGTKAAARGGYTSVCAKQGVVGLGRQAQQETETVAGSGGKLHSSLAQEF